MRVVLYTRVSTDDQIKGASLTTQRDRLQEWAEREAWDVQLFSDDGVSSSIAPWDRPAFAEALACAPDAIAVTDFDRLVRNELHWFQLRADRPELHVLSLDGVDTRKGDTNALVDGFRVLVSADEKRRIRERTMRGRLQRVQEGRWVGGRPPFGLRVNATKHLELDPDESATVRRAVALVLQHGLRETSKIADALNAEDRLPRQWSPRTGSSRRLVWRSETIRNLLRSPHLKGRVIWGPNQLEIPGPEIISPDDLDAVQAALAGTRRKSYRAKRVYPLSGRVVCEHGHYVGTTHKKDTPQYIVAGVSRKVAQALDATELEARVWRVTCDTLLDREKLLELMPEPPGDAEADAKAQTIAGLRAKVRDLEAAAVRLEVNLAKGLVSDDTAVGARKELADELTAHREHLARLESWQEQAEAAAARRDQVLTLADLDDSLRAADPQTQKHVYDVLELEAWVGELTDEAVKQRVRDILGEDYPEDRFTPGALSVWRTQMEIEALAESVTAARSDGRSATRATAQAGLRVTVFGQLTADTARGFIEAYSPGGRR